jgi:hypothetical protein
MNLYGMKRRTASPQPPALFHELALASMEGWFPGQSCHLCTSNILVEIIERKQRTFSFM